MQQIDKTTNILLNMNGGLLPEQLSEDEIKLLQEKFGDDWFYKLGYNDQEYKNPCKKIEEITIVSLEDIADVRRSIKSFQNLINVYEDEFDEKIKEFVKARDEKQKPLIEKMEELNKKLDEMMQQVIDNAVFGEDKFLQSLKLKADSYKEGRYKIIRHKKTTRKLNQSAFKAKYPKEFNDNAEIGLTKADNAIGKANTDKLCAISESYTFEFFDPSEHQKGDE